MNSLIVACDVGQFAELGRYIYEKLFLSEMPYFENFKIQSNALFSLRFVIIGITIGTIIAAISTVYSKRHIGDFIRRLLYQQCYDAESAKTLLELEYLGIPGIRAAIRTGGSLSRWVKCAEENEFYAEAEKQKAEFDELHKDEKHPPKYKMPEFKRDCATMHFYIPEELKYKAEVKFEKEGASWLTAIAISVLAIILCFLLSYFLYDILSLVDNFISFLKGI
jgi:hypothetical protein